MAAKRAASNTAINSTSMVYHRDLIPVIRRKIKEAWENRWQTSGQKLLEIKEDITPFKKIPNITRKKEVILNRLRSGHCRLTHSHLMEANNIENIIPLCPFCSNHLISVKHILLFCETLSERRRTAFSGNNLILREVLGDDCHVQELFNFIEDTQIDREI